MDPSLSPAIGPQPDRSAAALLDEGPAILHWMIEIRRDLHGHSELGFEEHRTSARLCEPLDQLGIEYRAGLGGTVGESSMVLNAVIQTLYAQGV